MYGELLGIGELVLAKSQRRLELTTANVANLATPGYKKQRIATDFAGTIAGMLPAQRPSVNLAQGALKTTSNPFDFAIVGPGFFQVRDGQGTHYLTRSGQFSRSETGLLIDGRGMALQTSDGADVVVGAGPIEVTENGTILQDGRPVARVGVFQNKQNLGLQAYSGSLFQADLATLRDVEAPVVKQGKLESSNVEMSLEMTEVMSAMRQAETGSRIIQTFDALMGQTISTFGRSGK